jgi:hypothetical protein
MANQILLLSTSHPEKKSIVPHLQLLKQESPISITNFALYYTVVGIKHQMMIPIRKLQTGLVVTIARLPNHSNQPGITDKSLLF